MKILAARHASPSRRNAPFDDEVVALGSISATAGPTSCPGGGSATITESTSTSGTQGAGSATIDATFTSCGTGDGMTLGGSATFTYSSSRRARTPASTR